jgi:hypothetical protein
MERNDFVLFGALALSFLTLLALALITTLGEGTAAAAWVQALGTIGAVAATGTAAIWTGLREERRRKAERHFRARALALRISNLLSDSLIDLLKIQNYTFGPMKKESDAKKVEKKLHLQTVPPDFLTQNLELLEPRDAAIIADYCYFAARYEKYLSRELPLFAEMSQRERERFRRYARAQLARLIYVIQSAHFTVQDLIPKDLWSDDDQLWARWHVGLAMEEEELDEREESVAIRERLVAEREAKLRN